jgi:hypothetical protein
MTNERRDILSSRTRVTIRQSLYPISRRSLLWSHLPNSQIASQFVAPKIGKHRLAFPINCPRYVKQRRWTATHSWAFWIEVDLFLYEAGPPVRRPRATEMIWPPPPADRAEEPGLSFLLKADERAATGLTIVPSTPIETKQHKIHRFIIVDGCPLPHCIQDLSQTLRHFRNVPTPDIPSGGIAQRCCSGDRSPVRKTVDPKF